MAYTPHEVLSALIDEVARHCDNGNWEAAAVLAEKLGCLIVAPPPVANPLEREALEKALRVSASILERASAIHGDIATLLKAFDRPKAQG